MRGTLSYIKTQEAFNYEETVRQMICWGEEQGAEPEGILYSNNMTAFLGEDSAIYFLELYMPVKNRPVKQAKNGKTQK